MLTDLLFLQKGQPWPPKDKSEVARLKEYDEAEALRAGKVNDIWPELYKYLRDGTTTQQDFFIGFPWIVTKKAIDTILGEPPAFTIQDNDAQTKELEAFLDEINYRQILREQVADIDAYGDSVQKLYIDEDGSVQVQSIPPEHWFPIVKRGTRKIEYHVLAFEFDIEEKDDNGVKKRFLEVEIHSKKEIAHQIWELGRNVLESLNSTIGERLDWASYNANVPETEPNPIGEFLIITAHNQRMSGDVYGSSSYTPDFKAILRKLIIRYSLANNILDVFSRPTHVGPKELETYDPVTGKSVFRPGEYKGINFDPKVTPWLPQALVWDGHLGEADVLTRALEEKLYIVAELPKAAVSMEVTGVAASGVAWKLAMTPLLSKCSRLREELDAAAKKALAIALRLAKKGDMAISIQWQDGLPEIDSETAITFYQLSNSPAFQGEIGTTWLLKNKLKLSDQEAKEIAEDPSRGGGLGAMV